MLLFHRLAYICSAVGGLRGVLSSTYTKSNHATAVAFTGPNNATLYELSMTVKIDRHFPYLGEACQGPDDVTEVPTSGGNAASFNLPNDVCKKGRHRCSAVFLLTFVLSCLSSVLLLLQFVYCSFLLSLCLFVCFWLYSHVWCIALQTQFFKLSQFDSIQRNYQCSTLWHTHWTCSSKI